MDRDLGESFAGLLFTFTWPGSPYPRDYVLRLDKPPKEQRADGTLKDGRKYITQRGELHLLFPPATREEWLTDATIPLLVVEGVKKTLAMGALGFHGLGDAAERPRFLVAGIQGVYGFRGKRGKQDGADGQTETLKGPLNDLGSLALKGRAVTIVYDADVDTNNDVRIARLAFAKMLREQFSVTHPLFADIPQGLGLKGIDDVCGQLGPETALRIIDSAYDPKKEKAKSGEPLLKTVICELPDVRKLASGGVGFTIPKLFPRNTIIFLTGESEAGKTHVALDLSNKIATGAPFLDGVCEQHPVLYCTRENPVENIADICNRLGIENGPGTNLHIWGDWNEEPPPIPGHAHIVQWVAEMKAQGLAPFVVIDSFIAFFDGSNENDAKEMRAFIDQGRLLLRNGSCGVMFLHHPGKAESAQLYRGSSDLKPAIDCAYSVRNTSETGRLERLYLKVWKRRAVKQCGELMLHYRETDGKAVFVTDTDPATPIRTMAEQLTNLLRGTPGISKSEFEEAAKALGVPRQRARTFINDGIASGQIVTRTYGRRQIIALADAPNFRKLTPIRQTAAPLEGGGSADIT